MWIFLYITLKEFKKIHLNFTANHFKRWEPHFLNSNSKYIEQAYKKSLIDWFSLHHFSRETNMYVKHYNYQGKKLKNKYIKLKKKKKNLLFTVILV